MENNNKTRYNGNGMDHPNIHRNPLFIAFKKAGVDDMTAVEAVLSATLLDSNIATKDDLKNYPTKEDLQKALANHPTKEDMKQYPTKEDLQKALANHPTKEDMQKALANHPTKEDLQKAINTQTKWMVGVGIALATLIVLLG